MITRIGILRKSDEMTVEQYRDHWENVHGPIASEHIKGIRQYTQNHVIDSQQRGIDYKRTNHEVDGFSQIWFDSTETMAQSFTSEVLDILDEDEKKFIGKLSLISVEPNVVVPVKDEDKLVKRMSILKRKSEIEPETFKHEWAVVHAEYVKKLPGIKGYVQNHILDGSVKRKSSVNLVDSELDGIVELWFESVEAIELAFKSPAGKVCMQHAESFIEEISTFLVEPIKIVEQYAKN